MTPVDAFSNLSMESLFCNLSRRVWYYGTLCNQISWYKSDFHILGLLRGSQGKQNRESVAFSPSCPISWPSGSCDWWKQVAPRGGRTRTQPLSVEIWEPLRRRGGVGGKLRRGATSPSHHHPLAPAGRPAYSEKCLKAHHSETH